MFSLQPFTWQLEPEAHVMRAHIFFIFLFGFYDVENYEVA